MSLFDLSFAVGALSTHSATVRRFAPDTFDTQGRANARTSSTFTTNVSVQPIEERLKREPAGFETSDSVAVFSTVDLQNRDRLTVPGLGDFEIERVYLWVQNGGFCEAVAKKLATPFEPR